MEMMKVSDYERMAKEKLSKMVYDFYASGADDQWTLKENSNAFSKILLRPRVLVNVSSIDTSTTIFGSKISMPIMVAPVALQKFAHPEGECATARATSAVGTAMAQSAWSTSSIEEVAESAPGVRFLQIYATKDRDIMLQLVKRAEKAGFKALIMTVDNARLTRREADIKNRFDLPLDLALKNFEYLNLDENYNKNGSRIASYVTLQPDPSFDWKDLQWLQTMTHLPILLKGVVTAEDAKLAVEANVSGIIVSNHGARQLDYVPPTIMILEEIVGAVLGKIPVFIDGGIRRGTDVFKSLALGAAGVFIGRPTVFSLAVDGESGVRKMLEKLRDEFELTMALSGCRSVEEITRNHIRLPINYFEY